MQFWLILCASAQEILIRFAVASFRRVKMIFSCYAQVAEVRNVTLMTCGDCHDWDDEMWQKVSFYHSRLVIQQERKAIAASSLSSFCGFSPSMPNPQCELSFSLESVIVTSVPSASSCSVTFSTIEIVYPYCFLSLALSLSLSLSSCYVFFYLVKLSYSFIVVYCYLFVKWLFVYFLYRLYYSFILLFVYIL